MRGIILLLGIIAIGYSGLSQTKAEQQDAYDKAKKAIQLMDSGDYDQSIQLLKVCCKLDPDNHVYPYEIGYALLLQKKYNEAIDCFEKVVKMPGIDAQSYQMLGNTYSMGGDKKKALQAYKRGLKIFPNSGRLYLEIGNLHENDKEALEFYEKGVKVDPKYPSNYYWLTKIFCSSKDEIWGMLYGEMFMNLERGSKRTVEISKLLFDTYKSEIQYQSDSSMAVSFCQNHILSVGNKKTALPFSMIYEMGLTQAISISDEITLESLNKIRKKYIDFYYNKKFNKSYANALFEWHRDLIKEDKFECYNYWMMMQGDQDEFNTWYGSNKERFDNFLNWFSEHPMTISKDNYFHRLKY
jgi:tetratricopeptide (TPR) repeat protein